MSGIVCPFCGRDYGTHGGEPCPVLDSSLARAVRGAVAAIEIDRADKAKARSQNLVMTPIVYALGNLTGSAQKILSYREERVAIIYNDDAADVFLGNDKQHIEDATKRIPLKTKTALIHNSPAEVWAFGSAAGPQNVSVLELPSGIDAAFAFLAKLA